MKLLIDLGLFVFGAMVGAIANWAIYQLRIYSRPAISPWGPSHPQASPRKSVDYLPIVGWWFRLKDQSVFGRYFWIRPMLIEVALAGGAVWFYHWVLAGGLIGMPPRPGDAETWYSAFALLFVLLTIATFIDFDEQTIPDWITIPGTLAALGFAFAAPGGRLPERLNGLAPNYQAINFMSPHPMTAADWRFDGRGLIAAAAILLIWTWALMPMLVDQRRAWPNRVRFMIASLLRPPRRTRCAIRIRQRRPRPATVGLFFLGLLLTAITAAIWYAAGPRWESYLGAILGLGFAGGIVWAVRLIGSAALGQEAMGFGDVTLMAMIGAFLGWQASLIVFGLAPFAAIFIALFQFLLTRNRVIAFGPYLSLAALALILGWSSLWDYTRSGFFQLPHGLLITILGGALLAMWLMLWGWRHIRGDQMAEEPQDG